jgi:hypothetical protein
VSSYYCARNQPAIAFGFLDLACVCARCSGSWGTRSSLRWMSYPRMPKTLTRTLCCQVAKPLLTLRLRAITFDLMSDSRRGGGWRCHDDREFHRLSCFGRFTEDATAVSECGQKSRMLSPTHRFLIAIRSLDGVVGTGLPIRRPEKVTVRALSSVRAQ